MLAVRENPNCFAEPLQGLPVTPPLGPHQCCDPDGVAQRGRDRIIRGPAKSLLGLQRTRMSVGEGPVEREGRKNRDQFETGVPTCCFHSQLPAPHSLPRNQATIVGPKPSKIWSSLYYSPLFPSQSHLLRPVSPTLPG